MPAPKANVIADFAQAALESMYGRDGFTPANAVAMCKMLGMVFRLPDADARGAAMLLTGGVDVEQTISKQLDELRRVANDVVIL